MIDSQPMKKSSPKRRLKKPGRKRPTASILVSLTPLQQAALERLVHETLPDGTRMTHSIHDLLANALDNFIADMSVGPPYYPEWDGPWGEGLPFWEKKYW